MKSLLLAKLKKWFFFALIGSSAYFVGYAIGQNQMSPKSEPQNHPAVVIESSAFK